MGNTSKIDIHYLHDAEIIKNAILSAQYEATRGANNIQLMLFDYNSSIQTDELPESNSLVATGELDNRSQLAQNQPIVNSLVATSEIQILPFNFPAVDAFPGNDFRSIGFTHHSNILMAAKSREERIFYITLCAREHHSADGILNCIKQNLFAQKGTLPNNFLLRMPSPQCRLVWRM